MAIFGLGHDIVEISRIEQQLERSQRLAERILTEYEFSIFASHKFPARFLAKRFAAKEAAVKALGIGIGNGIAFTDVEVRNLATGQPVLQFYGKFAEMCLEHGIATSFISIADEQRYATASVILECT